MTNKNKQNKDDQIKDILLKVEEIRSSISTITSAVTNEYDPPELRDVQNSLTVVLNYIDILQNDINNFIGD